MIVRILIIITFITSLFGCTPQPDNDKSVLYVSILPLRSIIQEVVGDDFQVETLVPAGASPETFEPTPKQFIALNRAQLIFNVGLIDFETTLLSKVADTAKIVNLSRGIIPIAGTCSHHSHGHHHTHGIDPHVWTSPRELLLMAKTAYQAIHLAYPDSVKYTTRYAALNERLKTLDSLVEAKISASGVGNFLIYHPALTYYARAYGIQQIAIEDEGKEPSAKRLSQIIGQARKDRVKYIFYQQQFPASTVEVIADDIGSEPMMIDPLREDVMDNILEITELITKK